jgi:membrane-bound serine protease (ClpP class)
MRLARIPLAALLAVGVTAQPAVASRIYRMEVDGPIFSPVVEYLKIALEQAENGRADAILLRLDTPGGSLDATKEIVQQVLGAAVPIIVYVAPSGAGAMSAGTFITLAGHVAAMAPGTTIGAAHPVMVVGGSERNEVMEQKIENYAVSFLQAIAGQRGRNVEWAVEAVRKSSAITAEEALEKKVIDLVAASADEVLERSNGRTVTVRGRELRLSTAAPEFVDLQMTLEQSFYFFLSQPTVIVVLLLVGLAALYVEFNHPGAVVPGVVGVIALLLAMVGFSIVPVNYTGAALLALGLLLLVAEVFVPSFGALGVGGIACLVGGSLLLFHTVEAPGLVVNRGVIAATAVSAGGLMLGVGMLVLKGQGRPVTTGAEGMVGAVGRARGRLAPRGKVTVGGEIWDAVIADGGAVDEGDEVEVVSLDGLKLVVAPRRRK